jgi:hypothetical protein
LIFTFSTSSGATGLEEDNGGDDGEGETIRQGHTTRLPLMNRGKDNRRCYWKRRCLPAAGTAIDKCLSRRNLPVVTETATMRL